MDKMKELSPQPTPDTPKTLLEQLRDNPTVFWQDHLQYMEYQQIIDLLAKEAREDILNLTIDTSI